MKALKFSLLLFVATLAVAQDNSPIVLPPEASQRLREGLTRLRGSPAFPAPQIGVAVVARSEANTIELSGAFAQIVKEDLRSQLASQGFAVLGDEVVSKGLKGVEKALQRRGEGDVAARTAELLHESTAADILLLVELILARDGTALRQFKAYDLRQNPARLLTSQTYRSLLITPPGDKIEEAFWVQNQRQGTTAMLMRFAESAASVEPFVPTYRLQVLGIGKRDFERWQRALRKITTSGFEMVRTPSEFGRDTVDVTPLWIRFPGEWLDLKDILDRSAEETLERSVLTVYNSAGQDYIVSLQETKEPQFFLYAAANGGRPTEKVGPTLSPNRKPTVAILYGQDLDAPQAALLDERAPATKLTLNEETAVRLLGTYFQVSGFEVKDTGATKRLLDDEIARSKLTKNLSGMRDALRRSNVADYLLLVRPDDVGKTLALTILDNRGTQVAFCSFPDLRSKLYEDYVDVRSSASFLRYVSGDLLGQLAEQAKDNSLRSVEVVLKNIRNSQQVMDVSGAFRNVEGVKSITDLKVDQPLASFRVNTTNDTASLVQKTAALAAQNQLGARGIIEVANEQQLVINIAPEWVTTYDVAEAEKTVEALQKPDAVKPKEIVEALRAARDSVWIVGLDVENYGFTGGGTAWTVRNRMLATNAHVLQGLRENAALCLQKGLKYEVVARNGSNLERKLTIDLERSKDHPGFNAFRQKKYSSKFITPYDVAILVTLSDAGVPLVLASPAELNALKPLDSIGYSGYPQENRMGDGRSQQTLLGAINTITTVFLRDDADPAQRKIIHFAMATTGGSSGSPILGPNGSVIGLNCAGDYVHTKELTVTQNGGVIAESQRIPVGFKYAQRVDMLAELIDGKVNVESLSRAWDVEYQATR